VGRPAIGSPLVLPARHLRLCADLRGDGNFPLFRASADGGGIGHPTCAPQCSRASAAVAAGALPLSALAAEKTKIGIVGSGRVGSAIGAVWVKAGHEVMFSSRNIEHDKALAARLGAGARAGTPRKAAAFGEVVMG